MGAFKGWACLSQVHIRENATTLVVNIKKWDLNGIGRIDFEKLINTSIP